MKAIQLFLILCCSSFLFGAGTPLVKWTMININSTDLQGDAHLLEFKDGKNILIDAGDYENILAPYLASRGIQKLDKVLISHPHKDHYSGINNIVNSGILVDEFRINLADSFTCDYERPWGCDRRDLRRVISFLREKKIPVKETYVGETYYSNGSTSLKVLYAYNSLGPIDSRDVNSTSIVLLLTVGKTRVLFTGDLSQAIGDYILTHGKEAIQADILKVPHHGGESLVSNAFFDRVAPKVAFVPAPRKLWLGERCKRSREYFKSKNIPTYVNGINGTVSVTFDGTSYKIN